MNSLNIYNLLRRFVTALARKLLTNGVSFEMSGGNMTLCRELHVASELRVGGSQIKGSVHEIL